MITFSLSRTKVDNCNKFQPEIDKFSIEIETFELLFDNFSPQNENFPHILKEASGGRKPSELSFRRKLNVFAGKVDHFEEADERLFVIEVLS